MPRRIIRASALRTPIERRPLKPLLSVEGHPALSGRLLGREIDAQAPQGGRKSRRVIAADTAQVAKRARLQVS